MHFVERQHHAKTELDRLFRDAQNVLIVHYASEGFTDGSGAGSSRIVSIAARNLKSGQTRVFASYLSAELLGSGVNPNAIERHFLQEFFRHLEEKKDCTWLHWNMRDTGFGFAALEHRLRVLGGTPFVLSGPQKVDLSRLLIDLYGPNYIGHPRIQKLMELNEIALGDFLTGAEEADHVAKGQAARVAQSTLRKVNVLEHFAQLARDRKLKTEASFWDIHGGVVRGVVDFFASHPVVLAIASLITLIGAVLGVMAFFGGGPQ